MAVVASDATRELLWLGELTVGEDATFGSGYSNLLFAGIVPSFFGQLSPSAFSESGTTYSIKYLVNVFQDMTSAPSIAFSPATTAMNLIVKGSSTPKKAMDIAQDTVVTDVERLRESN